MQDRGNLYQKLIQAAKLALQSQGTLPKSLDDLAKMAQVDPTNVRDNFHSLAELHDGLIYDGVTLLNDALRQGIIESDPHSPEAQLRSLARSYGDWAQSNPALFKLLIEGLAGDLAHDSTLYRFTISIRELFERKLNEMKTLGVLEADTDIDRLMLVLHCLIRGANLIFIGRRTDPWVQHDTRSSGNLAEAVFDEFMNGVIAAHGPRVSAHA